MEKIQIINPTTAYKWNEHKQIIEKINEIINVVNALLEHHRPVESGPKGETWSDWE